MKSRIENLQTILDTLGTLDASQRKPFEDALMMVSEDGWNKLVNMGLDELIDIANDSHCWYRDDDLSGAGYIHEDDLKDKIKNEMELVDQVLAKQGECRLDVTILNVLYKSYRRDNLLQEHKDLIEAILSDQGME